ncbi:MAG: AAA family ATPase [Myxococcaceae bacterium]|nr:AAA family ATPase [Myxococcaceae bacterium]
MKRIRALNAIRDLFRTHPVVTLVGPRQCGKTTLAKDLANSSVFKRGPVTRFDLEDARVRTQLQNPYLEHRTGYPTYCGCRSSRCGLRPRQSAPRRAQRHASLGSFLGRPPRFGLKPLVTIR